MAYCTQCGAESFGNFCPHCGTPMNAQATAPGGEQPRANAAPEPLSAIASPQQSVAAAPDPDEYALKWHKFLIYFYLWLMGLVSICGGGLMLAEAQHNNVMFIFAVSAIALGVYEIYVRFQLAQYKKGAPRKLVMAFLLTVFVDLIWYFFKLGRRALGEIDGGIGGPGILFRLLLAFLSWQYYFNREELFVK